MSDDESHSEDDLNFDEEEEDQSPKLKPQESHENDGGMSDILNSDDSDDGYRKQNKQSSDSKKQTTTTTNQYASDDNDSDIELDIFKDSDEDSSSKKKPSSKMPEKSKQIQKEKVIDSKKQLLMRKQVEKSPPVSKDRSIQPYPAKKQHEKQQRNPSSASKKQQQGQQGQRQKVEPFVPIIAQKPLIDEFTKQRVSEQQKNVQVGYEKKEALTELTRSVLDTADLRNFHNWIKSVIINKYSEERKNIIKLKEDLRTTQGQLFVMEIACGQGGDLKKWLHSDIALYIGVDISFNSLKEASRRTKDIMEKLPPHQQHKMFKYGFYQKDGSSSSEEFWKHIHDKERDQDKNKRFYFDLVSCQMAMHYMFGSEQHARNFFQNATSRLNDGGYLIVTCSDANAIVKKMRSRSTFDSTINKHVFGNKYYSMAFDSLEFPVGKPYGLKYEFYLQDAVGEKDQTTGQIKYTPEYLVELNNLVKLGLEYSLNVVENYNFIEFYKAYRNKYGNLFKLMKLDRFNADTPSIDPELWEISHCYRVLVFQKIDITNKDNKKYSFTRNAHLKQLSPEPIPINYVSSQPEKRAPKQ